MTLSRGCGESGSMIIPKSSFSMFSPTPADQMRDMAPDRPDTIESPHTVDAGHFQIESSFLSYSYDNHASSFSIAPFMVKFGVLDWIDFHLGIDPFVITPGSKGFGDIVPRLKFALAGNEEGDFALGSIIYATIPTGSRAVTDLSAYEAGALLVVSYDLSDRWTVSVQTELVSRLAWANLVGVGYSVNDRLSLFSEVFAESNFAGKGELMGRFDAGFTYFLSSNLTLDGGVNFGLTESADDFNPFIGFSARH